jgi:hypothetical protein
MRLSDKLFIIIFFTLSAVPMLYIRQGSFDIAYENRTATDKPEFIKRSQNKKLRINNKYSSEYDNYFNDRFLGRDTLVSLHGSFMRMVQHRKQNAFGFGGLNGWLFFARKRAVDTYQNLDVFNPDQMKYAADVLQALHDRMRKTGGKVAFIIAPIKSNIYPEFFPPQVFQNKVVPESNAEALVKYLKANTNVDAIFMKDELINHQDKGLMYYRNDAHWTHLSCYYAYLKSMEFFGLRPRSIKGWTCTDKAERGDIQKSMWTILSSRTHKKYTSFCYRAPMLNASAPKFEDTHSYKKYNRWFQGDQLLQIFSNKGSLTNKHIAVFGDSFRYNVAMYAASHFRRTTIFGRDTGIRQLELEYIEREKVNFVLIVMTEEKLSYLVNEGLFPLDDIKNYKVEK